MRISHLVIAVFVCLGSANAQDACVSLIQNAMYDTISTSNSQQTNSQARSSFCSWYSSYRAQNSSAGLNVGIPIGDIPVSVGGSYTYGSADALNQAMCQSSASASAGDAVFQSVKQYIDPNSAQAFDACVAAEQHGLKGTALTSNDNTLFNIELIYTPPTGTHVGTTVQNVSVIPADAFTCPTPTSGGTDIRSLVGKPNAFNNISVDLTCQRTILTTPVTVGSQVISANSGIISIHTDAGSFTQFFRAIPAANPLSDTAKVMAALPVGTILAWAGPISQIAQGWRLCDGTNGTPNLNHRIPRGTLAPGEVLHPDGLPTHSHAFSGTTGTFNGAHNDHLRQDDNSPAGAPGYDHTHGFYGQTDTQPNLPEVTYVMFIMKTM